MVNNYLIVKWFGFQMNFQISDRNLNFLCCVCQMIETRHFLFGFQMFLAFSNFQTEHLVIGLLCLIISTVRENCVTGRVATEQNGGPFKNQTYISVSKS